MSNLEHARSFRDLVVYQKARAVSRNIFRLTKGFPAEEMYSLTDQIRRSSRSVGAQIAEAWAKRRYEKHFISKLTDADAEQQETQHWIESAVDSERLGNREAQQILSDLSEIGRMLNSMIAKSDRFCGVNANMVREDSTEYIVEQQATI